MSDSPTPTSAASDSGDRRTLLVVLVIVAVLVVAALVAVFARGATQQLDPGTPQGVVQQYASAVLAGDFDTARELHSADRDSPEACDEWSPSPQSDTRLTLVRTVVTGDRATVTVNITQSYGGPFGGDSGYHDDFALERSGEGTWYVVQAPWEFQVCSEGFGE